MVEHFIVNEFEDKSDYCRWFNEMRSYFSDRTGIKNPNIVAIEIAEAQNIYGYKPIGG